MIKFGEQVVGGAWAPGLSVAEGMCTHDKEICPKDIKEKGTCDSYLNEKLEEALSFCDYIKLSEKAKAAYLASLGSAGTAAKDTAPETETPKSSAASVSLSTSIKNAMSKLSSKFKNAISSAFGRFRGSNSQRSYASIKKGYTAVPGVTINALPGVSITSETGMGQGFTISGPDGSATGTGGAGLSLLGEEIVNSNVVGGAGTGIMENDTLNGTLEAKCEEEICLVFPRNNSVVSIEAVNNKSTKAIINTKTTSQCTYGSTPDQKFDGTEVFSKTFRMPLYDYVYYGFGKVTEGNYLIYDVCRDASGKQFTTTHRFKVNKNGFGGRLFGEGTQNSVVELVTDSTGKESFKITPNLPLNTTKGKKDFIFQIELNGVPKRSIPITLEI